MKKRLLCDLMLLVTLVSPLRCSAQNVPPPTTDGGNSSGAVNLDLSSSSGSISASTLFQGTAPQQVINIDQGGSQLSITSGSTLTAAQYVAAAQVLTGTQSLQLNSSGSAIGGSVHIGQFGSLSNVVIPSGVTAYRDFGLSNTLSLSGNFTNAGQFFAVSSGQQPVNAIISAQNIVNQSGALLSSVLPMGLTGISAYASTLDLTLIARESVVNLGSIMSSGNLNITAGSTISNALSATSSLSSVMQAVGNINLTCQTLANQGLINSSAANINAITANIINSGTMSALSGNIALTSPGSSLTVLSDQGIFKAANELLLQTILEDGVKGTLTVQGGHLTAQSINFEAPSALVVADLDSATGNVGVSAGLASVGVNTGDLFISKMNLTGDPIYYSKTGNLDLSGLFGSTTFSTAAGDFVALAKGNITASAAPAGATINAANAAGAGGKITIASGVDFNVIGGASPIACANCAGLYSILGPAGTGGSVSLGNVSLVTNSASVTIQSEGQVAIGSITTSGTTSVRNGGSVTITAAQDIQTGAIRTFGAGGAGGAGSGGNAGAGGAVNLNSAAGAITIAGDINSSGGGGGGGNNGSGGAGGNAGAITVAALNALSITGPVLAAGGGGGGSTSGGGGSGGGAFGGGGGFGTCCSASGTGGAALGAQGGLLFGLGELGNGPGGNVGENGTAVSGGAAGNSAAISLTGSTISVTGTIGSAYASLSSATPNPFSTSPYASLSIAGNSVTVSASAGAPNLPGTVAISNGGTLNITNGGAPVTNINALGYFGKTGGSATVSQASPGVPLNIGTLTLYSAKAGTFNVSSAGALNINTVQTSLDKGVRTTAVLNLSGSTGIQLSTLISASGGTISATSSGGNVLVGTTQSIGTNLSLQSTTGTITTGNITSTGNAGGTSGGNISLAASGDITTGFIRTFGGGGNGSSGTGGAGGNAGSINLNSSGGAIVVGGDLNAAGGGGGGGNNGFGGAGGSGAAITLSAPVAITVQGPVLATGGGGGGATVALGGAGGGAFGASGSPGGCCGLVPGGTLLTDTFGELFGVAGTLFAAGGPVASKGIVQTGGGLPGTSGDVSLTSNTIAVNGTIASTYASLSGATPNPFSTSPYAGIGVAGRSLTLTAGSFVSVTGALVVGGGGTLSQSVAGVQSTNYNNVGFLGGTGTTGTLALATPGATLSITTITLFEAVAGGTLAISSQGAVNIGSVASSTHSNMFDAKQTLQITAPLDITIGSAQTLGSQITVTSTGGNVTTGNMSLFHSPLTISAAGFINTLDLDTSGGVPGGSGATMSLTAGTAIQTGFIRSFGAGGSGGGSVGMAGGSGGAITLSAGTDVTTGDINSSGGGGGGGNSGAGGKGGAGAAINVTAGGNIAITGPVLAMGGGVGGTGTGNGASGGGAFGGGANPTSGCCGGPYPGSTTLTSGGGTLFGVSAGSDSTWVGEGKNAGASGVVTLSGNTVAVNGTIGSTYGPLVANRFTNSPFANLSIAGKSVNISTVSPLVGSLSIAGTSVITDGGSLAFQQAGTPRGNVGAVGYLGNGGSASISLIGGSTLALSSLAIFGTTGTLNLSSQGDTTIGTSSAVNATGNFNGISVVSTSTGNFSITSNVAIAGLNLSATAGGSISTLGLWVGGVGGAGGTVNMYGAMASPGGNGGNISLSANNSITVDHVRTYGGGGGGSYLCTACYGGDGGAGGKIDIVSKTGLITITADLNSSGGGGGGAVYSPGNGGAAGDITLTAPGSVAVGGPILAAGGGDGGGNAPFNQAGGGGSFGGGGGSVPFASGGGGFQGGGGAFTGAGIGSYGGGMVGGKASGAAADGSIGAGGSSDKSATSAFGVSASLGAPIGLGNCCGLPKNVGKSAVVTLSGASVNVSGTVASTFAPLSALAPNPFTTSPFADYSIAGKDLMITASSGAGTNVNVTGAVAVSGKASQISGQDVSIGRATYYETGAAMTITSAGSTTLGSASTTVVNSTLNIISSNNVTISGAVVLPESTVSIVATNALNASSIDVSGLGGMSNRTAGGNGGLLTLTAGTIQTGYLRSFGGGGFGAFSIIGGDGGIGGKITVGATGKITISGDVNVSGGGGGGNGTGGAGGKGGNAGQIIIGSGLGVDISGPLLAAGGGGGRVGKYLANPGDGGASFGGGGASWLDGAGGGLYGGGSKDYINTGGGIFGGGDTNGKPGKGGANYGNIGGIFGVGGNSHNQVAQSGSGAGGGAAGYNGNITVSGSSVQLTGTVASSYGPLSSDIPNPFTTSPFSNVTVYGNSVTLTASGTNVTVAGDIRTNSSQSSGNVTVSAPGDITIGGKIDTFSNKGQGGNVTLTSSGGIITVTGVINAGSNGTTDFTVSGFLNAHAGALNITNSNAGQVILNSVSTAGGNGSFGGDVVITLSGTSTLNILNTVDTSSTQNTGGDFKVQGNTTGTIKLDTAGNAASTAVRTSGGGTDHYSGAVRILAKGAPVTVTGGINTSATTQATSGEIVVDSLTLNITGLLNSSNASGKGATVDLSSVNSLTTANINTASTFSQGGLVMMASGVSGVGSLLTGTITTSGTGAASSAGAVVLLSSDSITTSGITATGLSGATGGNVSFVAGKAGTPGNITFSTVTTTGGSGGNLTAVSLGDTGTITNGGSAINTSALGMDFTAGSISMSSQGTITIGNINASAIVGGSSKAYGGSVFLTSAAGGTAITTGTMNLSATNFGGNLIEVYKAGSSASSGAVTQTGGDRNGYTYSGTPTASVTDIIGDQLLSFGAGGVTGYNPGGFMTADAPGATLSVDTQGDSRMFIPVVVLTGDINLLGVTSIVTAGAASPISLYATGNITLGSGVSISSPNAPAAPVSFQSNQGTVSLASIDISGTTGGSIVISSPTSFTLAPGQSLRATSSQAGSTGGSIIIAVPSGSITLGAPGNTTANVLDASGPSGGLIQLEAQSNIDIYEVRIVAKATGPGGTGGTANIASYNGLVNMYSGGGFNSDVDVSSATGTGGNVTIFGKMGINLLTDGSIPGAGTQVINANGSTKGGAITFQSPQGSIYLADAKAITATGNLGGSIGIFAPIGTVTSTALDVSGLTGGTIDAASSNFILPDAQSISAVGTAGAGGKIGIYTAGVKVASPGFVRFGSAGNVTDNTVDASGTTTGGNITVFAGTSFTSNEVSLFAKGGSGNGGAISAYSYGGAITLAQLYGTVAGVPHAHFANVDASSATANGGAVSLQAGSNLLSTRDPAGVGVAANPSYISASGAMAGGSVGIYAGTNVNLTETSKVLATGTTSKGGAIGVQSLVGAVLTFADASGTDGGAVVVQSGTIDLPNGASLLAVGTAGAGGSVTLTNTTSKLGNYVQLGTADNRTGNVIDASGTTAGGNIQVTTLGNFVNYETSLLAKGGSLNGGAVAVSTTDGAITFYNEFFGVQNFNAGVDVSSTSAAGGKITLTTTGTTSPAITVLQDTTVTGGGSTTQTFLANGATTGGTVTITAPGNVDLRQMLSVQATGATGGSISLQSGKTGYTGMLTTSASGGTVVADSKLDLNLTGNIAGANVSMTSDNGGVNLNASAIGTTQVLVDSSLDITYLSGTLGGGTVDLLSRNRSVGSVPAPLQTSGSGLRANANSGGQSVRLVQTGTTNLGASAASANFVLTSDSAITIANPLSAQNITISTTPASNANITINANPNATTSLTLNAGGSGSITQAPGVKIAAPTLILSSGSGDIGTATALSTTTNTLTANTTGNVHISNSTSLTLMASSSGGTFDLNTNGNFTLANPLNSPIVILSTGTASNGNITINANPVGTNTLTLSAGGSGTIVQAPALNFNFTNVNLSSGTGNVGTLGTPIRTGAANLTVNTGGGVHVDQTGAVNLGNSSSGVEFVLNSTGNITASGTLDTGALTLNNTLLNGTIGITGNVTSKGTTTLQTAGSGTLNLGAGAVLSSAGTLSANAANIVNNGTITGTTPSIQLISPGALTISGTGAIGSTGPGASVLLRPAAGNNIVLNGNQTFSASSVFLDGAAAGSKILFGAGTTQTIGGSSSVRFSSANSSFGSGAQVTSTGASNILFDSGAAAPDLTITTAGTGATVSSVGGTIGITPSPGGKVNFAGAGTLRLDGAPVSITTPTQTVTVAAGVTVASDNNLTITAPAVQNDGAINIAGTLSAMSTTPLSITGGGSITGGSINLTSTGGPVNATQGSISGPISGTSVGNFSLSTTAGSLTLADITATGGAITANAAGGAVAMLNNTKLAAGSLVQLTAATNIALGQGGPNGVSITTPSGVTLTATTGTITIDDKTSISTNNAQISAAGDVTIGKAGGTGVNIASTGAASISSTGAAVTISDGSKVSGSGAVTVAGTAGVTLGQGGAAVTLTSGAKLSVGSAAGAVSIGDGATLQGTAVDLSAFAGLTTGKVGGAGLTISATAGDLTANINSGGWTAGDKVALSSTGNLTATVSSGNLSFGNQASIQATGGSVGTTVSNGNLNFGNGATVSAGSGVSMSGIDMTAGSSLAVTANGGKLDINLSGTLTGGDSNSFTSGLGLTLSGTSLNAGNNNTFKANGGAISATATAGNLQVGSQASFSTTFDVSLSAAAGTLSVGDQTTVTGAKVQFASSGNSSLGTAGGTKLNVTATSIDASSSAGTLTVSDGANLTASGNVNLNGLTGVTIGQGGNAVSLNSTGGTLTVGSTNGNLNFGNNTGAVASGNVALSGLAMTTGSAVTVTSNGGKLDLSLTGALTTGNTNSFTAGTGLTVSATSLTGGNSNSFKANSGSLVVSATAGDLQVGNQASITATADVSLSAAGALSIGDQSTVTGAKVQFSSSGNATLGKAGGSSFNVTGASIDATSSTGNLTISDGAKLTATTGNIALNGLTGVTIGQGSKAVSLDAAGGTLTVGSGNGNLDFGNNTSATVGNDVSLSAVDMTTGSFTAVTSNGGKLDINLSGALTGGDNNSFTANGALTISAASVDASNNTAFKSTNGGAISTTATSGNLQIGDQASFSTSADVSFSAPAGTLLVGDRATITGANVQFSSNGNNTLGTAGGLSFNVTGTSINASSSNGSLTISDGAKFNSTAGNIDLSGRTGVTVGQSGNAVNLNSNGTLTAVSSAGAVTVGDRVTLTSGSDLSLQAATGVSIGTVGGTGTKLTAGRMSGGYSANSVVMADYDMSAFATPGKVSVQTSAGNITVGDHVQMQSLGASVGLTAPGNFNFGTGNLLFAQGGNVWLNGAGEVNFAAGNVITAIARTIPAVPDITIDGQTIQDYQGGNVAIDVSAIIPNYDQYITSNYVMNRSAGGTYTVTGNVVTKGTTPSITNGGSVILVSSGTGVISAQNSSMAASGGVIFVDPPGDINIDAIVINAFGPGLIAPPPPPPPPPLGGPGGLAPTPIVVVPAVAPAAAGNNNGSSNLAPPGRPTVPTDTQDMQISVAREQQPTQHQVLSIGTEYQVNGFCQPYLIEHEEESGLIGTPGTVFVQEEGPGQTVSLKGGKLLVVSGRKAISVKTDKGDVLVPAGSTAIVEQKTAGQVTVMSVAGKAAQLTMTDGIDRKILEALPGQEIAAGEEEEELIAADGVDREVISSSLIFAKSRVVVRRFRGDQMANVEVMLHCHSTNRLQRRVDRDRESMRAADASINKPNTPGARAPLSPVAYNVPLVTIPGQRTVMPLPEARIVSSTDARIQLAGKGKVTVRGGEALIEAETAMLVNLEHSTVRLSPGDIVLVQSSFTQDRIQLLWSNNAKSISIMASARMLKLTPGTEALISFGSAPHHTDGISRRRITREKLDTQRQLATSEVSLLSVMTTDKLLSQLLHSNDRRDHRSMEKIKKMAAILSIVCGRHGAYNNSELN